MFISKYLAEIQKHSALILGTFAVILLDLAGNGHVGQRRQPESVAPGSRRVVQSLGVLGDALIPNHDGSRLVAYTTREVMTAVHVVEEEVEHVVRLLVIPAHDALGVGGVHEQGLLFRDRMDGDDGMDRLGDGASQDG